MRPTGRCHTTLSLMRNYVHHDAVFFSKFFDHFLFLKELHSFNCVKERYRLHFRARRGIRHGVWDKISQKLAIFCKLNSNDVVYPKRKPNSRPIWQNMPTVWLFFVNLVPQRRRQLIHGDGRIDRRFVRSSEPNNPPWIYY